LVAAFEKCVLLKLEQPVTEVKKGQSLLAAKVDSLRLLQPGNSGSADLPDDIHLPISSVRALQALDGRVASDVQLKQLLVCGNLSVLLLLL